MLSLIHPSNMLLLRRLIPLKVNRLPGVRCFASDVRSISDDLENRGLLKQVFPNKSRTKIDQLLEAKPRHIYAGFDPTADSLHVGNFLILMGLIRFQRAGHHPIALIGGTTGRIGDPSGRTTERAEIDGDVIDHNTACIKRQIETIFTNHSKYLWNEKSDGELKQVRLVDNTEWYQNMNLFDFFGKIGRYFRIGNMLHLTAVKSRLEDSKGISFTEFSYQIFQSYDWLQLYKRFQCLLQLGGSDQMGNLCAGYQLINRVTGKEVYGITLPLLMTRAGEKFGKSAGNAIWLDAKKTTEFSLYQFFVRVEDDDVERLLKMLTFLSLEEIDEIMAENRKATHLRKAQKRLAEYLTILIHGRKGLEKAKTITAALYEGDFNALANLTAEEMHSLFTGATYSDLLMEPGLSVLQLALKAKCFKHEREATRLISEGGFYINQNRCQNISEIISPSVHVLKNNHTLLRVGKRNYFIVKWVN